MDTPKVGDTRTCRGCGKESKYRRISRDERDEAAARQRGQSPDREREQFAWVCDYCGMEDRVPS